MRTAVIFYVYELRFPEGKPFYVGKGSDSGEREFKRAHFHWRKHQLVKTLIRAMKDRGEKPAVAIVFESDDEAAAFAEECRLIKLYGRRFDGGLLWNIADGGKGGTPRGRPLSDEHKAKISAANRGAKRTPEACERMRRAHIGRKRTPDQIARSTEALRGRPVSAETRAKIAAAQRGIPRPPWSAERRAAHEAKRRSP